MGFELKLIASQVNTRKEICGRVELEKSKVFEVNSYRGPTLYSERNHYARRR